jgi:hypothetical protein
MPRDVERRAPRWAKATTCASSAATCAASRSRLPRVVILDVLHYVTHAEQERVLRRVHDALVPGGRCCCAWATPAPPRLRHQPVGRPRVTRRARAHRAAGVRPPLPEWIAQLRQLGMQVEPRP